MKTFNKMTEKQMERVGGGFIGLLAIFIVTYAVAPLGLGAAAGWGVNYAVKNK